MPGQNGRSPPISSTFSSRLSWASRSRARASIASGASVSGVSRAPKGVVVTARTLAAILGRGYACDDRCELGKGGDMQVRDGMTSVVLTVGPGHSLREAACRMAERKVGAAVVVDPDGQGPGIVTERDVLLSL